MRTAFTIAAAAAVLALVGCASAMLKPDLSHIQDPPRDGGKIYTFTMKDIDGKAVPLSAFKGKVLLLVNVASKCGNTPQYEGLEETYRKLHGQGFEILGFPANNFFHQEPGDNASIKQFCERTYGVQFPMFAKISVKGRDMDPLYRYLTTRTGFDGDIGWNFAKFLVNRRGRVVARFSPRTKIDSPEVMEAIQAALR